MWAAALFGIVWDCWPQRQYYLLLVAIAVFGAVSHTRVPAVVPFKTWVAQVMVLFFAAMIVLGAADHMLMRRILRPGRAMPDADAL